MSLHHWVHEPLSRLRFTAIGVLLAIVKVGLDFAVARHFGHPYSLLFYVNPIDAPLFHMSADRAYWETLSLVTMPFLLVGTALTVRRLHDAAMSSWFVLLFFVPFANLLFFLTMVLVPSRPRPIATLPADLPFREPGAPIDMSLPTAQRYPKLVAASLGTVILLGTLAISVGLLGRYGIALMLGSPMISGFATGAFYGRLAPGGRLKDAFLAATLVLALSMVCTLFFAIEGLGCFFMFFPLLCGPGYVGAFIGFMASSKLPARATNVAVVASVGLFFVLLGVEQVNPLPALTPPPVVTSIDIDAPPSRVWPLLPSMATMPEPDDWAFRYVSIAYPIRATLEGVGLGARRTCEFTTGPAIETVDVWSPGHVLGFTIDVQPDPMRELTLYKTVRQPHLDGYVRNRRGELSIEELPGGRTRLTGRSWYEVRITPETYWRWWSDIAIHKIHERVLRVVKERAEGAGPNVVASADVGADAP